VTRHRRAWRDFTVCLLLLAAAAAEGGAQETTLLRPGSGGRVETMPGRIVTVSFLVGNRSDGERRYLPSFTLPDGWRLLTPPGEVILPAGGDTVRLFTFTVPSRQRAGEHRVQLSLRDPLHLRDSASSFVTLLVRGVRRLDVQVLEGPRIARTGEPFAVRFLVTNGGNSPERVMLTPQGSNNARATVDSAVLYLPAGVVHEAVVTTATDPHEPPSPSLIVTLAASLSGDTADAAAAHAVELVPLPAAFRDPWLAMPLAVTARGTGGDDTWRGQIELAGEGYLDEDQAHRLALLLRGPDNQTISSLGLRDEYVVRYVGPEGVAVAGDASYALTPLTEYGRYAAGAGGSGRAGDFTITGFANTARFLVPRENELGLSFGVSPIPRVHASLQYLGKQGNGQTDIVSLRGVARLVDEAEVDAEYGSGWYEERRDDGYWLRVSGAAPSVTYDLRHVYGGPNFNGYYRDGRYTMASVSWLPYGLWRVEGQFRQSDRNLGRDTLQLYAPRTRLMQAGAGFGGWVYAGFRREEFDDMRPSPQFSRTEHTLQLRTGYSTPEAGLMATVEIGQAEDRILGRSSPFRRINVYADVRPTPAVTYGFTVESSREQNLFGNERPERVGAGARLSALPFPGTRLQFDGSYSRTLLPSVEQSTLFLDAALEQQLPWGHIAAVRYRRSEFAAAPTVVDNAWRFDYTVPLSIPFARRNGTGELTGRIVDAETGMPMAGMIVRAGGTLAVSEEDGTFAFPPLTPARHYLQLDPMSAGAGRVTVNPLEEGVYVGHGSTVDVLVPVTRAAVVTGAVLRRALRDSALADGLRGEAMKLGGIADVVVEASDGADVHRRRTDSRGTFRFERLRPGNWAFRVVSGSVPAGDRIEPDSVMLPLAPGATAELSFTVTEPVRTIRVVKTETLQLTPAVTPPPAPKKKPRRR
jgi:hypothetical protein